MLIWMCALHCEAKTVIDFYRLKKTTRQSGFDRYVNEHCCCVVSGVGAVNMAAATAWAAALYQQKKSLHWINLGVAGHRDLDVGELLLASEIASPTAPRIYHCLDPVKSTLSKCPVTSTDSEQTEYPENRLLDMEAYAFMATASRFSDIKWCQSMKVVSDNRNHPAHRDKSQISRLVANQIPLITDYAEALVGVET